MCHPHPRLRILITLLGGMLLALAQQTGGQTLVQLAVAGRASANPALAARGAFVVAAWGATSDNAGTDVYVAVSRDAGATFAAPVRVTRQADARIGAERPPVVVLPPSADGTPHVAVLWTAGRTATTVTLARSIDGGRTFQKPIDLQTAGAPGNRGWAAMAADERGQLHVVWLDHRETASSGASAGTHVHAAATRAPATPQPASTAPARDGVAMAQQSGLYYVRVAGAAEPERVIAKGVCYCCKTTVAAGPANRVVAAWRHVYPGNLRDIAAVTSTDGGLTFAGPARVSEDGWSIDGCPENGPSAAVDAGGTAHIAWPTVIGGAEPTGAIFYSTSRDGRAFTPRVRVPTLAGRDPEHVQLAARSDGHAVVAWDEVVNGRRTVVLQRLSHASGGRPVGPPSAISGARPARHPALTVTPRGVLVAWTDGAPDGATRIAVKAVRLE